MNVYYSRCTKDTIGFFLQEVYFIKEHEQILFTSPEECKNCFTYSQVMDILENQPYTKVKKMSFEQFLEQAFVELL